MAKLNQKQIKMDIRSAVNYAENQIANKVPAFFINTEFGVVAMETNGIDKVDPLHPVTVVPWAEAPNTRWASTVSAEEADFYVSIDIYKSMLTDHMSVIEGFTRCMFLNLGCRDIDDVIVNAAVFVFIDNYDAYSVNVNAIEREFLKNHFSGLKKSDPVIRALVREVQQQKIMSSEQIYEKSQKALDQHLQIHTEDATNFYDNYCQDLFGLILYANMEAKEQADNSYRLLVSYKDEADVRRSTSFIADIVPRDI